MFQGALEHKSIYKGTPNKDLDKAWAFITHSEFMSAFLGYAIRETKRRC